MTTRPFVFLIPLVLQLGAFTTVSEASLQCFTCGLPDIQAVDPENKTKHHQLAGNSCEQFLNETGIQESQKFLTQCPPETLSCYNARGSMISGYDEENNLAYHYMGCSEVKDLPFKTGCHKTMHVAKRRPEMIELSIEICYCFEDKCNHPDSLAMTAAASSASSSSSTYGNFVNLYLLFLRQDIKWMSFSISGFIVKAFCIMLVKCVDSEIDVFVWHSF